MQQQPIKPMQQPTESQPYQKSEQTVSTQLTETSKIKPKRIDLRLDPTRSRYGKMIIFFEKGPILISIGPDYLCFLGGFTFFLLLGYFLCRTVESTFENYKIVYFAYFTSILQCGSYLLVALSNPSIALPENNPIKQVTTQNQHRVCKRCGAQAARKTYHCRDCDVCVKGYDHHCPWTSKCIGQGNLYRFYAFITITPVYILIFLGLMMGCLIVAAQNANQHLRKQGGVSGNGS